jgi:putative membrane protein
MLLDAMLAWVHFVLIFGLVGCLFAEVFFYRDVLAGATFARLRQVDLAYGILAGAVVLSGIARVVYSPKTATYFLHNPIFWTKMSLFVAVALLSLPPTLHFVRVSSSAQPDGTVRVERRAYVRIRALLTVEVALLLLIPLCAALMARGYH